jgi:hypothetical protein
MIARRIAREPLVQFVVVGALLFGLHLLLRGDRGAAGGARVVVGEVTVAALASRWTEQRGRPPTAEELRREIDAWVRDEVLYREAIALGLDREDPIVRERLVGKLELLARGKGDEEVLSDDEVRAFFEANLERYRLEGWTPELEQVRNVVELDLVEERRRRALEEYYARIRSKYVVEIPGPVR